MMSGVETCCFCRTHSGKCSSTRCTSNRQSITIYMRPLLTLINEPNRLTYDNLHVTITTPLKMCMTVSLGVVLLKGNSFQMVHIHMSWAIIMNSYLPWLLCPLNLKEQNSRDLLTRYILQRMNGEANHASHILWYRIGDLLKNHLTHSIKTYIFTIKSGKELGSLMLYIEYHSKFRLLF